MTKIIVYSAIWCSWCRKTKEFFATNNIKFENRDIEEDPENAKEMIRKSGQSGIPVIDIDGKIIIGFDESEIKKTLKIQ